MSLTLQNLLVDEIFHWLLVFARVGTALTALPGVGHPAVPMRIRLLFALATSYVISIALYQQLPSPPDSPLTMFVMIGAEIFIGALFATVARLLLSTLHSLGMVIAMQSSLASAMFFDPGAGGQSAAPSIFMVLVGTVLIMAMDLHHVMLAGFVRSYQLWPAAHFPNVGDSALYLASLFSHAFTIAIQISAPFLFGSLFAYLVAGIMGRVMPTFQAFFVMMPLQILGGFALMALTLHAIMLWYSQYVREVAEGTWLP